MSAQHTPGPWEFVHKLTASENHRGFFVRAEKPSRDGKWAIAEVQPGDEDGKLGEANARLIAAAPELLEALRDVIGWIPGDAAWHTDAPMKAVQRARNAIAKAVLS